MESTSSPTKNHGEILIRPARSDEMSKLAFVACNGYAGSVLDSFLMPFRQQYPEDALRAWNQRMTLRWLDPRMISIVAYLASDPEKVIGYAQFSRVGDDEGAKRQIASRKSVYLSLMYWYHSIMFKVMDYLWPDRSVNRESLKLFEQWNEIDDKMHWNPFPERQNRWHLRSIVVSSEWRGKGVGTLLMKELLDRGREEGTVIGLEASPDGEYLYRKVGFELLSRFYYEAGSPLESPDAGGVMMWRPEKMKIS